MLHSEVLRQLGFALQGIIPRTIDEIFNIIHREESKKESKIQHEIQVSYVEVYLSKVKDLLNPLNGKGNLRIRESFEKGIYVEGVTQKLVSSTTEVHRAISIGESNKIIGEGRNFASSILALKVKQTDKETRVQRTSTVSFSDLAGLPRKYSKLSKKMDSTLRRRQFETLSALGQVLKALTQRIKHVPYRDLKLTRLLSDSIGGNAKTCILVTASPAFLDMEKVY